MILTDRQTDRQTDGRTGYPSIDRPWLKYYERALTEDDIPSISAYHMLYENNHAFGNEIALIYFNKKISFSALFEKIKIVAANMQKYGVRKGDIITFQTVNMPQTVVLFYALSYIGAVANFAFITAGKEEIHSELIDTESKWYVTIDGVWEKQKDVITGTLVEHVLLLSLGEEADWRTRTAINIKYRTKREKEYLYWKDLLVDCGSSADEINDGNIPVTMVYTGGTTGKSKAVVLSNRNLNALTMQYEFANINHKRGQIFMNSLPPFIAFGLVCSMHMPLCLGFSEVLIADPNPSMCGKNFIKYRPNYFVHGMEGLESIYNHPKVKKMDLEFVKMLAVGGEAIPLVFEEKINKLLEEQNSKAKISIGYGMTEVAATVVTESPVAYKNGTVGIPLPGTVIKIVEPETQKELGYDEIGEVCFHAPTMMVGYYRKDEETDLIMKMHSDGLEWIHSGDLGRMDDDGFLTIVGRIKRIIQIREDGIYHKVFPKLIEDIFEKIDGVVSVSVVGRPQPYIINELVMFVVKNEELDEVELKERLDGFAKLSLASWEQPVEYRFIDKLPRTTIGKVDFRKLEEVANSSIITHL